MGFSEAERTALLAAKGVGPTVVSRLEQIGYGPVAELAQGTLASITRRLRACSATVAGATAPRQAQPLRPRSAWRDRIPRSDK